MVEFGFREGLLRDGVQRTNDNKLEAVLNNWIETHCSEVSWDHLIQVLTELEFIDIARDVKEAFSRGPNLAKVIIAIVSFVCLLVNFMKVYLQLFLKEVWMLGMSIVRSVEY